MQILNNANEMQAYTPTPQSNLSTCERKWQAMQ